MCQPGCHHAAHGATANDDDIHIPGGSSPPRFRVELLRQRRHSATVPVAQLLRIVAISAQPGVVQKLPAGHPTIAAIGRIGKQAPQQVPAQQTECVVKSGHPLFQFRYQLIELAGLKVGDIPVPPRSGTPGKPVGHPPIGRQILGLRTGQGAIDIVHGAHLAGGVAIAIIGKHAVEDCPQQGSLRFAQRQSAPRSAT